MNQPDNDGHQMTIKQSINGKDKERKREKSGQRSRDKQFFKDKKNVPSSSEEEDDQIDMFADESVREQVNNKENKKQNELVTDQAGYYIPIVGEVIGEHYRIIQKLGKGVFGNVIKVTDSRSPQKIETYAVKVLRKNQITRASGYKEYKILSQIHAKRKLKRIMKVFDIFEEKGHLCIVCELLGTDLRSFSHKKQPTLSDIRIYAIGMILISHELRLSKIIHADIKPDNFLFKQSPQVSKSQGLNERSVIDNLRLADFGTSFEVQQYNNNVEEMVARYYRAPQIILGTQMKNSETYSIDIWAMACSLFELYTNQFLFNGNSNNDMLKLMMETKGRFSIKMLNKSIFREKHFDNDLNFLHQQIDKITKQPKEVKMQVNITAERDLMAMLKKSGHNENVKELQNFRDFLERCLALNPKDRITPQEAIEHPFLHFQTKLQI